MELFITSYFHKYKKVFDKTCNFLKKIFIIDCPYLSIAALGAQKPPLVFYGRLLKYFFWPWNKFQYFTVSSFIDLLIKLVVFKFEFCCHFLGLSRLKSKLTSSSV